MKQLSIYKMFTNFNLSRSFKEIFFLKMSKGKRGNIFCNNVLNVFVIASVLNQNFDKAGILKY